MPRNPTAAEHYGWSRQNEAFYATLGGIGTPNPDWAVTVLFYAAVHAAQAALVAKQYQPRPRTHEDRKVALRRECPQVAAWYETLEQRSRLARYECDLPSGNTVALMEAALQEAHSAIATYSPPPYR
jgi:hypothetical protein